MKKFSLSIIAVVLFILSSSFSRAQEDIARDRPEEEQNDPAGKGYIGFHFGLGVVNKIGEYGGAHIPVGLNVGLRVAPRWDFVMLIQANTFGTAKNQLTKVSGAYMVGVSFHHSGLVWSALLGEQDILTRSQTASLTHTYDPVSGISLTSVDGAQHDGALGYYLSTEYDWIVKPVYRQSPWGFALGPMVAVTGSFTNVQGFKPIANVLVNLKLLSNAF